MEEPVPKYKRLYPGGPEVPPEGRLPRQAAPAARRTRTGNVTEVLAEYDPDSRGGNPADGRKVKGATIHWVDAADRRGRRGAAVRQPVHRRRPRRRGQGLPGVPEPRLSGGADRLQGGGLPGAAPSPASASSSCGRATSAWTTRTPSPAHLVFNRSVMPEG